jgi:hypothetical protein
MMVRDSVNLNIFPPANLVQHRDKRKVGNQEDDGPTHIFILRVSITSIRTMAALMAQYSITLQKFYGAALKRKAPWFLRR